MKALSDKERSMNLLKEQICTRCTHWRWTAPYNTGKGWCVEHGDYGSRKDTCEDWSLSFNATVKETVEAILRIRGII